MDQNLADRGDREELIDTIVEGVHSTNSPPKYGSSVRYGSLPADYEVKY